MHIGIIGQGFGGSALAWQLQQVGHAVTVFDRGIEQSASWMASGLINPVTLRRRKVVQQAQMHLNAMQTYYESVEASLGQGLLNMDSIREVLIGSQATEDWGQLADIKALKPFIGPCHEADHQGIQHSHVGQVQHSGRLHSKAYLKAMATHLGEQLIHGQVDHIEREGKGWMVSGHKVDALILAEGVQAQWTKYFFGELPFAASRGEGLTIAWDGEAMHHPYHQSHFLLPEGGSMAKLGATYSWDKFNDPPSKAARLELLDGLKPWFSMPGLRVVDQWVGIRPTMKDRIVRLGWHDVESNLGFLNGLGSRGAMTAPYWAKKLITAAPWA